MLQIINSLSTQKKNIYIFNINNLNYIKNKKLKHDNNMTCGTRFFRFVFLLIYLYHDQNWFNFHLYIITPQFYIYIYITVFVAIVYYSHLWNLCCYTLLLYLLIKISFTNIYLDLNRWISKKKMLYLFK